MEYTLWNVILLNIPLVLAEYVCCMILTRGLTKCRPQGKAAVLMLLPYSLLLILPSSVFYLHDLFGEVSALLALSLLETAGWTVTLRAAWKKSWQWSLITGAMVVFLYGITDEMGGFFLTRNFDLKNPAGLAAYMGSSILEFLLFFFRESGGTAYQCFLMPNSAVYHFHCHFFCRKINDDVTGIDYRFQIINNRDI